MSLPIARTRVVGLLRLFRLELPVAAGLCVLLGQLLALGSLPDIRTAALGFLSIFFISATALILNDYFDYEIDLVNAPERPLPSGQVSKGDAVVLSIVVALFGFVAAAFIRRTALVTAVAVWLVGVAYNARFKRTGLPGNLMVAASVGMTFVFGGIAVGKTGEPLVWWFGVLAMLFDLGEEIAADAMDAEGDRRAGSRSLAVVIGVRQAVRVSAAVFAAVVIVSLLPFVMDWLDLVYLVPMVLMDGVIVVSVSRLLSTDGPPLRRDIRRIYIGGSLAILVFIVMRLAAL